MLKDYHKSRSLLVWCFFASITLQPTVDAAANAASAPKSALQFSADQLDTAVLMIIFRRPDKQARILEQIRKVKPKKLFIAADGARSHVRDDKEKCAQARKIIEQIDWACEVKTLFQDKNIGVDNAVIAAITWFFDHVNEGIIFEDDCLPSTEFFWFCQNLLERYRDDERIFTICGLKLCDDPLQPDYRHSPRFSYFFSKPHIFHWGWATWKRAWDCYDHHMTMFDEFKSKNLGNLVYTNSRLRSHNINIWQSVHSRIKRNKNDPHLWDARYSFTAACHNGLTIFPAANLVENIGFDSSATHTRVGRSEWKKKIENFDGKHLRHPPCIIAAG